VKKHNFFFLLFSFFLILGNLCLVPLVAGEGDEEISETQVEYWENVDLIAQNLQLDVLNFPDDSDMNYEIKNIHCDSIEAYPEQEMEDNLFLYTARLYLHFEIDFLTMYSVEDTFPDADEEEHSKRFLHLETSEHPETPKVYPWTSYNYYTEYAAYDELGDCEATGFDNFIFIDASYNSLKSETLDFGATEFSFANKEFTAEVYPAYCEEISFETVEYKDNVICNDGSSFSMDEISRGGDAKDDVIDWAEDAHLGLKIEESYSTNEATEGGQQGESYFQLGSGIGNNDNKFALKMIPDVSILKDEIRNRYRYMVVDTNDAAISGSDAGIEGKYCEPMEEKSFTRVYGWHVENKIVHTEFEIPIDVYSLTEVSYDEESDHADTGLPAYQLNDMYWENLFTGTTEVVVTLFDEDVLVEIPDWFIPDWSGDDIWGNVQNILIIVAVIAVIGITCYLLFYLSKAKKLNKLRRKF